MTHVLVIDQGTAGSTCLVVAAGSVDGARSVARDHVLHSGHLLEVILDQVGRSPRTTSAA